MILPVMVDFRSWVAHIAEQDTWLGAIARDVRRTGWTGSTPASLREWVAAGGFTKPLDTEVEQLERFYRLHRQRILDGRG